jgi:nicotinamidase-related amidase
MNPKEIVKMLEQELPINMVSYSLAGKVPGLIMVDFINGFCKVGAGALAPPKYDAEIESMIKWGAQVAKGFISKGWPILVLQDCHEGPEPPYPDHAMKGTGEEELIEELSFLKAYAKATFLPKNCINGYIGGQQTDGKNIVQSWINDNGLDTVAGNGICTDICLMDLILTLLSVRNHGLTPSLKDIVAYTKASATYDLPREVAVAIGLPQYAAHPREITDYMGLYFMASRGAIIAHSLELE